MTNYLLEILAAALLVSAAIIDFRKQIIPDRINLGIFIIGCIGALVTSDIALAERIIGMFSVASFMLLMNFVIKGAFGGGDIKLMAACGMFYGAKIVVCGAIYGILFSGIYGIILVITKQKDLRDRFALGPFLVIGILLSYLNFNF